MPSKTPAQRKLMGAALAAKRGAKPASPAVAKVANGMAEEKLREFAKKKKKAPKK